MYNKCIKKNNYESLKRLRKERIEKGLCRDCGKPAYPYSSCEYHRNKNSEYGRKHYSNFKKQGKCVRCGIDLHPDMDEGFISCLTCRAINNIRPK